MEILHFLQLMNQQFTLQVGIYARARARRSQPGEKFEGNLKIFLMPIGQSTLPDLCPIVISDIHDEM